MCTDTSWLPNSIRKNLDVPKVVYESGHTNYGGFYALGTNTITVVEGNDNAATIAHEYLHHIQYHKGTLTAKTVENGNGLELFDKFSFNKAIRLYFRTQWWEMEALLFQKKLAPSEVGKFWLKALVLPERFEENICM